MAKILFLLFSLTFTCIASASETHLEDLDLSGIRQGWGTPHVDCAVDGPGLRIGGEDFDHGIGTHSPSTWQLDLDGKATEFRAKVGVQEYPENPHVGSVEFIVSGDGKVLWRSGIMRGGDAAKDVSVSLAGVKELKLEVTDGGDGNASDHADWVSPVVIHHGAPLPPERSRQPEETLLPDLPGEPPNAAARISWEEKTGSLALFYDGRVLFRGRATGARLSSAVTRRNQAITQSLTLSGSTVHLEGIVYGDDSLIAAETRGAAQQNFPLIRTTNGGPSRNLRNNAVYDRTRDWLLGGVANIVPGSATEFRLTCDGRNAITLTFKPRFYQRHKNLPYFRPWTYQVWQDSVTGWSSWWAYRRNFNEKSLGDLLAVWKEKHFADYGYRYIQIDDCYQGGENARHQLLPNNGYAGGHPETWLIWRQDGFPGGLSGYVSAVKSAGFDPAIWIGSFFGTTDVEAQHPEWFVRGANGKPFIAPWAGYSIDASNPSAVDALIRPTYRGLHTAGIAYVKIDQLRHYLYDNLNHNLDYCRAQHTTPADILRDYLEAARQELGPNTFILACWGVLPETIGLANACRIGGDGYGPFTMQQYNSWNGIVWRNDPDHCDVYPAFRPAAVGDVQKTTAVSASPADTIIRPALASIAGCMLMLSDKPEVYREDANLLGLRRASPVLFSVPGQLYDFDESKSRSVISEDRTSIMSGANPSPIDASQFGSVCPWWLNEFDRPFEHWNVLHRLNWSAGPAAGATVKFADLGLDPAKTYLVYEFWSRSFLGSLSKQMELPAMKPMEIDSFAIREQVDHPQLLSTNRHLSQGGADLLSVQWTGRALAGRSHVITGDRYEIALYIPAGYRLKSAEIAGQPAITETDGPVARMSFFPRETGEVEWSAAITSP